MGGLTGQNPVKIKEIDSEQRKELQNVSNGEFQSFSHVGNGWIPIRPLYLVPETDTQLTCLIWFLKWCESCQFLPAVGLAGPNLDTKRTRSN